MEAGAPWGDKQWELGVLTEAETEIGNLAHLKSHFPEAAICFPLFHGTFPQPHSHFQAREP